MNRLYKFIQRLCDVFGDDLLKERKEGDSVYQMLVEGVPFIIALLGMIGIAVIVLPRGGESIISFGLLIVILAWALSLLARLQVEIVIRVLGLCFHRRERAERHAVYQLEENFLTLAEAAILSMPEDMQEEYWARLQYAMRYDHMYLQEPFSFRNFFRSILRRAK